MAPSRQAFSDIYQTAVREVSARMPEDWTALARHNAGWRRDRFDAYGYLASSEIRYWHALGLIIRAGSRSVLDVGGFLGAFPLALSRLGYDVAVGEKYGYYDSAMDGIARHLAANGVKVIDADYSEPRDANGDGGARYDAVTCMAVAEHLAHSPKALMDNIRHALQPGGLLVFEVPNLAFWPKRYAFFVRGQTVHAPMEEVYRSEIPFTGHHREYTLSDARYVVTTGGFEIVDERTFNYSVDTRHPLRLLKYLPALLLKEWAEVIMIGCRKPA